MTNMTNMDTEVAGEHPSVFFSYTRRQPDESWAGRVITILRHRYEVRVWIDKREIRTGYDFRQETEAAIRGCDAFVFLGSSGSLASQECEHECVYALAHAKPIIPLFLEDIGWGQFPAAFQRMHYQQLQRADDDEQLAALIGKGLIDAGIAIDPSRVPQWTTEFDRWAGEVHPPYAKVRQADPSALRNYVEECSRKLGLSPKNGYHNLNLALLFLRLHEHKRAAEYARIALGDLPGRADAHYFVALVTAAAEPLLTTPRSVIERILQLLDNSISLVHEWTVRSERVESGLPWLLKAAIAYEYFGRNGLISRIGDPGTLLQQAHKRFSPQEEIDRLLDSLPGLSRWSRHQIESYRSSAAVAGQPAPQDSIGPRQALTS